MLHSAKKIKNVYPSSYSYRGYQIDRRNNDDGSVCCWAITWPNDDQAEDSRNLKRDCMDMIDYWIEQDEKCPVECMVRTGAGTK